MIDVVCTYLPDAWPMRLLVEVEHVGQKFVTEFDVWREEDECAAVASVCRRVMETFDQRPRIVGIPEPRDLALILDRIQRLKARP